jgi:hypothetical protein
MGESGIGHIYARVTIILVPYTLRYTQISFVNVNKVQNMDFLASVVSYWPLYCFFLRYNLITS